MTRKKLGARSRVEDKRKEVYNTSASYPCFVPLLPGTYRYEVYLAEGDLTCIHTR